MIRDTTPADAPASIGTAIACISSFILPFLQICRQYRVLFDSNCRESKSDKKRDKTKTHRKHTTQQTYQTIVSCVYIGQSILKRAPIKTRKKIEKKFFWLQAQPCFYITLFPLESLVSLSRIHQSHSLSGLSRCFSSCLSRPLVTTETEKGTNVLLGNPDFLQKHSYLSC